LVKLRSSLLLRKDVVHRNDVSRKDSSLLHDYIMNTIYSFVNILEDMLKLEIKGLRKSQSVKCEIYKLQKLDHNAVFHTIRQTDLTHVDRPIYTVGHKKGATFIFTITLAIVDRFQ